MNKFLFLSFVFFCLIGLSECYSTHPQSMLPPPRSAVFQHASWILAYPSDTTTAAFNRVMYGLTEAGYEVYGDKNDLFLVTKSKTVGPVSRLAMQISIRPVKGGSEVTFGGKYVPIDSAGAEVKDSGKWVWMKYGSGNPLQQQIWDEVHRIAIELFPGAQIGYY